LAEKKGHKIVVCGQSGVGKTTLARTLDGNSTLFMDLEAGDAAIEGHNIDVIRPRTWQECRDFACYLGGSTLHWQKTNHTAKRTSTMCANVTATLPEHRQI
jgi:ABC-type phosphate/phosphonate transport system ATPase subunit